MSTTRSTSGKSATSGESAAAQRSVINTVPAQEVKRRGVRAIVEKLATGPVHVLQHNQPAFVALGEEQYQDLVEEIEESRIRMSLADVEEGRVRFASPQELTDEIFR